MANSAALKCNYQTKKLTVKILSNDLTIDCERKVLVLGDNAVAKKIEQSEWDSIKNIMLEHLIKGSVADAFTDGILKTADYVKNKFPIDDTNTNENQIANEIKFINV